MRDGIAAKTSEDVLRVILDIFRWLLVDLRGWWVVLLSLGGMCDSRVLIELYVSNWERNQLINNWLAFLHLQRNGVFTF